MSKNYLWPNIIVWHKLFLYFKLFFMTFFNKNLFSIFFNHNFSTQIFFSPEYVSTQIFIGQNIFDQKVLIDWQNCCYKWGAMYTCLVLNVFRSTLFSNNCERLWFQRRHCCPKFTGHGIFLFLALFLCRTHLLRLFFVYV